MGAPAAREQRETEIGILDDGIARPSAGVDQRASADKAHGAVRDDGVDLVPLHHADIEEAGIFAVHHRVHDAPVAVAMVLRRLHETDGRRRKGRNQILQPIRMHHIVCVEHTDDLGLGRGVLHAPAGARRP